MSSESSGADYLRRLKQDQERPAAPSGQVVTSLPTESAGSEERRRSPRYKCEGSAEFQVGGTDVRTWGTFTDLSLNGCYVEMTATFPVGAMVDLALELNGLQVEVRGEVRVSYPFLGIGIASREVSDDNRVRLQEMVRSLLPTARVGMLTVSAAGGNSTPAVSQTMVADPAAALQAVVEFFEARQLLTKEEFIALLQKSH